jgi:hypothetical protein
MNSIRVIKESELKLPFAKSDASAPTVKDSDVAFTITDNGDSSLTFAWNGTAELASVASLRMTSASPMVIGVVPLPPNAKPMTKELVHYGVGAADLKAQLSFHDGSNGYDFLIPANVVGDVTGKTSIAYGTPTVKLS